MASIKRMRSFFSSDSSNGSTSTPDKKAKKQKSAVENLSLSPTELDSMSDQPSPLTDPIPTWAQGLMHDVKCLNEKMDDLSTAVKGIKNTVETLTKSVQHACDTAQDAKNTADMAMNKANGVKLDLTQVENVQQKLEGKIHSLNEHILRLECQSRRSNLKIDNVPERPNETPSDTEYIFRDILHNMGMPDVNRIKIERCHRTGPKGEKPRTIIVKFNWYGDRDEIWANRRYLKGSDYWMREDFPAVYEDRRRALLPYLQAAKRDQRFKKASLHVDKLSLNGKLYSIDQVDQLPDGLKPSQIATRSANGITLFFRKESVLSNFHPAHFKVDNVDYNCSEQFYQAKKAEFFGDDETMSKIMATDNPLQQFRLGRNVKGYANDKDNWYSGPAVKTMEQGTAEKFRQNKHLADALVATGDNLLAEASPTDTFWGIGFNLYHAHAVEKSRWTGQNKLGDILTNLRSTL